MASCSALNKVSKYLKYVVGGRFSRNCISLCDKPSSTISLRISKSACRLLGLLYEIVCFTSKLLFHHYKELKECMGDVKQIEVEEASVYNSNQVLMEEEVQPRIITLDSYFLSAGKSVKINQGRKEVTLP